MSESIQVKMLLVKQLSGIIIVINEPNIVTKAIYDSNAFLSLPSFKNKHIIDANIGVVHNWNGAAYH